MANTSHFPVGITGAIVSNDWGDDVVGTSCESIRDNSTHFQTRLSNETGRNSNLSRLLTDMKQAVLNEAQLNDSQKLDVVADIDSLEAQLQKPEPQESVVQALWSDIEKVAEVAGVTELVHRAADLT